MNHFLRARSKPLIIAHRGASKDAPENTLKAFRLAIKRGADAIEFDVRPTLDKELVILHDSTLDRTTNGTGKLAKQTYAQIAHLDAGEHEHIPKLSEVFDVFGKKVLMVIETKNYTSWFDGTEAAAAKLVAQYDYQDRVVFGSFLPWAAKKIRRELPDAVTCGFYLHGFRWLFTPWAKYYNCFGPHNRRLNRRTVSAIHAAGKLVNTWVVDDEAEKQRLARIGVNMITTNTP